MCVNARPWDPMITKAETDAFLLRASSRRQVSLLWTLLTGLRRRTLQTGPCLLCVSFSETLNTAKFFIDSISFFIRTSKSDFVVTPAMRKSHRQRSFLLVKSHTCYALHLGSPDIQSLSAALGRRGRQRLLKPWPQSWWLKKTSVRA